MILSTSKFTARLKSFLVLSILFLFFGFSISTCYAIPIQDKDKVEKPNHLVIIDKAIADKSIIIESIDFSENIILKEIDNQRSIADQMDEIQIKNFANGFQTVTIFSHGQAGEIQLGGKIIDASSLEVNTAIIQSLNRLTNQNSSINFYACEAAKGLEGKKFFQALTLVLDAKVALSNNITGVSGDWNLEIAENYSKQAGLDLAYLTNHYTSNLQIVNNPYCITQFATFSDKVTEMTVDWDNRMLYFAGENLFGRLYRVNSTGATVRISNSFANSASPGLLFNYISTDIVYYNDSIFTNSSGSLVMVDLSPSVLSSRPHVFTGNIGAEAGMAVVGDKIYTTDGKGTANAIYEYNIATNTSSVVVGGLPSDTLHGLEYCEATGKLYLAISPLGIYEVNVTAGTYTLVTDPLPNTSRSNFAIDPTGAYAFVHNGSTVYRYNLSTGAGEVFVSGLLASNFCDLKFGPASKDNSIYSLYIGGNDRIYEVCGFVPVTPADAPTLVAAEPVLCPLGPSSTSISISAADKLKGSTAWYLYSGSCGGTLINSNTTGVFNVSPSATTTYYVRGEGGCNAAPGLCGSITIIYGNIQPPVTALTYVSCNGESNGEIEVLATGGSVPYQYSLDNGLNFQFGNVFTGLAAGDYNILVKEGNGCVNVSTATLTEPESLVFTYVATDASCNGAASGSIKITATGGLGIGYEYSINGGLSWQISDTFLNLAAGTYAVMIRDREYNYPIKEKKSYASASCETNPVSVIVGEPSPIIFTTTKTDVSCNGGNDGSITFVASGGGSGTYQYSINGGANYVDNVTITGLTAGVYQTAVREKDNISCEVWGAIVDIAEPTAITFTTAQTNISCYGETNGQIIVTAIGGVGGAGTGILNYSKDGGIVWQVSNTFNGLAGGNYDIVVRDQGQVACKTAPASFTITSPTELSFTVSQQNVSCNGNNDGQIIMTASGGVGGNGSGTYEYSIDGGFSWQAGNTFNSLFAANYQLMLRDAVVNSCTTGIVDIEITEPDLLGLTFVKVDANCSTNNDGEIHLTAIGGMGGAASGVFEYSINGGSNWQASADFTGLVSGNYSVTVRDNANVSCATLPQDVFIDLVSPINMSYTYNEISCNGNNDGKIEITASGGSGYEYTIGGNVWQNTGLFENLVAGDYQLIVREVLNPSCGSVTVDLSLGEPTELTFTTTLQNATCTPGFDGEIVFTASGGIGGAGSGTYEYSIDNLVWQDSNIFSGLEAKNYFVTIRDKVNPGCKTPGLTVAIEEYSVVDASAITTNVTCFGANDGSITITATGGVGYEYSIDNGSNWISTSLFENLTPATYTILVREAATPTCITAPIDIEILEPGEITFSIIQTDISCFEGNDGSIEVIASGGSGTFEYSKDGGTTWQTENTFSNLLVSSYDIVVRDLAAPACFTAALTVPLSEPTALTFSTSKTDLTCYGSADGEITITTSGGLGGNASGVFEYSIDGIIWQDSNVFAGLDAATYPVNVQDKNHIACQAPAVDVIIGQPTELTFTLSITNATCGLGNDGQIVLTASGGESGTYDYSVDGGSTWLASNTFSGLSANTYSAMIRDKVNTSCLSAIEDIKIINFSPIDYSHTYQDVTCPGAANGEIVITVIGGSTYNYSIDNGTTWQASNSFLNLNGGSYEIVVQDQSTPTCQSLTALQDISEDAELLFTYTYRDESCNASADGKIEMIASGGASGTFEYSIDGVSWVDSGLFENLSAGAYNLNVRDKASIACVSVPVAITLVKAGAIGFETVMTPVSCNGSNDGEILVNMTIGGLGATYEYTINNGVNWVYSNNFTDLVAGFYLVGIREEGTSDCQPAMKGVLVSEPAKIVPTIVKKHVSCSATNDGEIAITSTGTFIGVPEYTIDGGLTFQVSNTFTGIGVGSYTVFVRDSGSPTCTSDTFIVLIEKRSALSFIVTKTNVTCFGGANGTMAVGLSVGMNPADYEFSKDDGLTWQASNSFTGLSTGTYLVLIKEKLVGTCPSYSKEIIITQAPEMTMTPTIFPGNCDSGLASIDINASPSYGTLLYSINNGVDYQSNKFFGNLSSGTYELAIKNTSGCVGYYTENPIELTLASEFAVAISATPMTNICTYYPIVLTASGVDIDSYTWSTGENTESIVYSTDITGSQTFTVDAVSKYGCLASDNIVLDFRAGSAIGIIATPNDTVCAEGTIELAALAANAVSYLWTPDNVATSIINVKIDDWGSYMYTIEVTNSIGCISMDSIQLVFKDCTGLNELDVDGVEINVFPNPSYNGKFNLEISGVREDVDIWIIDFNGRLLLEDKLFYYNEFSLQKQFDLKGYGRGVYFIRMATDEKVSYKRVILM